MPMRSSSLLRGCRSPLLLLLLRRCRVLPLRRARRCHGGLVGKKRRLSAWKRSGEGSTAAAQGCRRQRWSSEMAATTTTTTLPCVPARAAFSSGTPQWEEAAQKELALRLKKGLSKQRRESTRAQREKCAPFAFPFFFFFASSTEVKRKK